MSRTFLTVLVPVVAVAFAATPKPGAAIPPPLDSIVPDCITVDPGGLSRLFVQVIGVDGQPLGGELVRVIFNSVCSDDSQSPIEGLTEDVGSNCQSPLVLEGISDESTAIIVFEPRMGGCCETTQAVRIEVDPGAVTIGWYDAVSSPDWSYCASAGRSYSDGKVDLADFAAFTGAFLGTPSDICYDYPTGADEECDEQVNLSDFAYFFTRFVTGDGDCPSCE